MSSRRSCRCFIHCSYFALATVSHSAGCSSCYRFCRGGCLDRDSRGNARGACRRAPGVVRDARPHRHSRRNRAGVYLCAGVRLAGLVPAETNRITSSLPKCVERWRPSDREHSTRGDYRNILAADWRPTSSAGTNGQFTRFTRRVSRSSSYPRSHYSATRRDGVPRHLRCRRQWVIVAASFLLRTTARPRGSHGRLAR